MKSKNIMHPGSMIQSDIIERGLTTGDTRVEHETWNSFLKAGSMLVYVTCAIVIYEMFLVCGATICHQEEVSGYF